MKVTPTALPDVRRILPRVFADDRGLFFESWNARALAASGIKETFVQDNHSCSKRGVLRGLHYQIEHAQGKLVRCVAGEVFDVAVDLRRSSPTFGRHVGMVLSAENRLLLWIPPGFAHGFVVTSAFAQIEYKCTDLYDPASEIGVAWDDPALAIPWPVTDPVLSSRDRAHPRLADQRDRLPLYAPT